MKMIENKDVALPTQGFKIVDKSTFSKIRNGHIEGKSPPPGKERKR